MLYALMDTHTLLWLTDDDPRLSNAAKVAIADHVGHIGLSVVSVWEIAIKVGNGKPNLHASLEEYLAETKKKYEIEILPLEVEPILLVSTLPFPHHNHKDPYDRIIISQCLCLNIPMISIDAKFDAYGVQRIW